MMYAATGAIALFICAWMMYKGYHWHDDDVSARR